MRVNDPAVRRHRIPSFEYDDIAGNDVGGLDLGQLAGSEHLCGMRDHCLKRVGSALGRMFLGKADQGVERHDGKDSEGELEVRRVAW